MIDISEPVVPSSVTDRGTASPFVGVDGSDLSLALAELQQGISGISEHFLRALCSVMNELLRADLARQKLQEGVDPDALRRRIRGLLTRFLLDTMVDCGFVDLIHETNEVAIQEAERSGIAGTTEGLHVAFCAVYQRILQKDKFPAVGRILEGDVYTHSLACLEHFLQNVSHPKDVYTMERDKQPLDVHTERLIGAEHAGGLYLRHLRLLRGSAIATAIRDRETDPKKLDAIRKITSELGAFLIDSNLATFRDRLTDPRWRIHQTSASVHNLATGEAHPFKDYSDIQVYVPENRLNAPLYFQFPDEARGDLIITTEARSILERIQADHSIAACVADISTDDVAAGCGLAGLTRQACFEEILRDDPQVEYAVAETFQIHGVEIDGQQCLCYNIDNLASARLHFNCRHYQTLPAWVRKNDKVEVSPGVFLLLDWLVFVHELRKKPGSQSTFALGSDASTT